MMRRCQNSRYEEGYKMQKVLIALLLIGMSFTAHAQRDKSRTWEWSIAGLYQDSKNMDSESGSSLQVDNALGIGFNVGYNWTDHFTLGFDFDFMQPDYRAVLVDDTVQPAVTTEINHELSQFNGRLKATYNFLEGPFRPFVEAGLGWSYFDSNVADGDPIVGCWWHPYWGYICDGFYDTFDDTVFSYGAGLGLKYQFAGDSFLKLSYNSWRLDGVGAAGDENVSAARLEYGWNF
jgi:opacity protein-like surface antigen